MTVMAMIKKEAENSPPDHRTLSQSECENTRLCAIQPMRIRPLHHQSSFFDDFSRYFWVFFTLRKDAKTIRDIYEMWRADAENKAGEQVCYIQTDIGGEYQKEMAEILK